MPYDLPPLSYIDAYKPGIDMTLVRENLKLTIEQRFEKLKAMQALHDEVKKAGQAAFRQGNDR